MSLSLLSEIPRANHSRKVLCSLPSLGMSLGGIRPCSTSRTQGCIWGHSRAKPVICWCIHYPRSMVYGLGLWSVVNWSMVCGLCSMVVDGWMKKDEKGTEQRRSSCLGRNGRAGCTGGMSVFECRCADVQNHGNCHLWPTLPGLVCGRKGYGLGKVWPASFFIFRARGPLTGSPPTNSMTSILRVIVTPLQPLFFELFVFCVFDLSVS